MIDEIQVQNLALIGKASLEPSRGMTVLTGETGAGKTALLSALKLLLGARADKDWVRENEDALLVSGRFSAISPPTTLAEDDPARSDTELVVSRRVSKDGRSRVSLDGQLASVKELAEVLAPTIDLCGQHEHQQLMKQSNHVHLLDWWGSEEVRQKLQAYVDAYDAAQDAAEDLRRVREFGKASQSKLEEERYVLQRIGSINPQKDEYEDLLFDLKRSEYAEALARGVDAAHQALSAEGGVLDALAQAINALESVASYDESLGSYAQSLREVSYVVDDVACEARSYRDTIEFDPDLLVERQERMAAIQGLLRSYGPRMVDVLARRNRAVELLSYVEGENERDARAQKAFEEAERELKRAAEALDRVREKAAPRFAAAVSEQMARLEMGGATLRCQITPLERGRWTRLGPSAVEFLFCPAKGTQARPFTKIASGGEISRVMLAIKVVLGAHDKVDTLVFDEVDAGVGGSAAVALAEVLAELAQTHQVIVVTHLAQVAVHGEAHYVVEKALDKKGRAQTKLHLLQTDERPAEIARMLSGDVTETSLAHAREMLGKASSL